MENELLDLALQEEKEWIYEENIQEEDEKTTRERWNKWVKVIDL